MSHKKSSPVLPTLLESVQLHELHHNLNESKDYITKLQQDQETLHNTHKKCYKEIEKEFDNAINALMLQKQNMLNNLDKQLKERNEKLEKQIDELQQQADTNNETKEECKDLIQNMENDNKKKRLEREQLIKNKCQSCIDNSPCIDSVPIHISHTFDRKSQLLTQISTFGKLHHAPIETGKHMPFTKLNSTIVTNPQNIAVKQRLPKKKVQWLSNNKEINIFSACVLLFYL